MCEKTRVWGCRVNRVPGESLPLAMIVAGGGSYTEHRQGLQDNWIEGKALLPPSGTRLGVGPA